MTKRSLLKILTLAIITPLRLGWTTAFETPEVRRVAKAHGVSLTGISMRMVAGAILYLCTLVLVLMSITGVFGLTHLFEVTGTAAPGFSDRAPGLSLVLNLFTAIWIAVMVNMACCQAARTKLQLAGIVVERKKKLQEEALAEIAASFRVELQNQLESQLADDIEAKAAKFASVAVEAVVAKVAARTAELYEVIVAAEHFISDCLAQPEIAERLNTEQAAAILTELQRTLARTTKT